MARLGEFTDEHVELLLKSFGQSGNLPDWLPRKPLFLSYLAKEQLLEEVLSIDDDFGFGNAWDRFIELVSNRESKITKISLEPLTVRGVLQELASDVRATVSGTGPITALGLAEVFTRVTLQEPGNQAIAQLQRLPGLTVRGGDESTRHFVDEDMLSALQGFSVATHILTNRVPSKAGRWLGPLSKKATVAAAHLIAKNGADEAAVISIAHKHSSEPQFCADCLQIAIELSQDKGNLDCRGLKVSGAHVLILPLEAFQVSGLVLEDCEIEEISLDEEGVKSDVELRRCDVNRVKGIADDSALPRHMFVAGTKVEKFDNLLTNAAIVRSDVLSDSKKALLTILRKLYFQAGAGRKISALKRGLPQGPQQRVDNVISVLERNGLVSIFNQVVHPVIKNSERVRRILSAPAASSDPIIAECE